MRKDETSRPAVALFIETLMPSNRVQHPRGRSLRGNDVWLLGFFIRVVRGFTSLLADNGEKYERGNNGSRLIASARARARS